jgi:hypothetical protein
MHEIVSTYWKLRSLSKEIGDCIAADARVGHHEQPAAFFGMAFNTITLTIELLDFYYRTWGEPTTTISTSVEEARQENTNRVILIQKMCLIELMSSLEFCSKHIIAGFPESFGTLKGRIYLRKIMEQSRDVGIINAHTFEQWEGMIELRNCLIHNNGYASVTHQYSYPEVTLSFNDGLMVKGSIRNFTAFTEWLLRAARDWIMATNNSVKSNPPAMPAFG